jgi:hypothetical protein
MEETLRMVALNRLTVAVTSDLLLATRIHRDPDGIDKSKIAFSCHILYINSRHSIVRAYIISYRDYARDLQASISHSLISAGSVAVDTCVDLTSDRLVS